MDPRHYSRFVLVALAAASLGHGKLRAETADSSRKGGDRPSSSNSSSAANNNGSSSNNRSAFSSIMDTPLATDPSYRLSVGDEIAVMVYGEGDLSTGQRIDDRGIIRLPYAGDIQIVGKSVRDAEHFLEQVMIDKKLLKRPMVSVTVRDYASKEVTVLGAVNGAGKFHLPREKESIEIVDLISYMGNFRLTAKSNEVKVTHTDEQGVEHFATVNVEKMIKGSKGALKSFLIYPGDRLYVPERLW